MQRCLFKYFNMFLRKQEGPIEDRNMALESFAVHARILGTFLETISSCQKRDTNHQKQDDIIMADFFGASWNGAKYLKKWPFGMDKLHKQVAHLTYSRYENDQVNEKLTVDNVGRLYRYMEGVGGFQRKHIATFRF